MITSRTAARAVTRLILAAACLVMAPPVRAQMRLVRVAVTPPAVSGREYKPLAGVWAGSTKRELNRLGGVELVADAEMTRWIDENTPDGNVVDRKTALRLGEDLDADVVIYTGLSRRHQYIAYSMAFLEVKRDVVQRSVSGTFDAAMSPGGVGRVVNEQMLVLNRYLPQPSELADPAESIRDYSIDPAKLPPMAIMEGIPPIDRFLYVEQLFSFFRVFPGEEEYIKFEQQKYMTRMVRRRDMDEELASILQGFYLTGDFAIRHGLQAYLVKDCSLGAINMFIANNIPVFFGKGILTGYSHLAPDGYCLYHTIDKLTLESLDLSHRDRVTVMVIVPRPGRRYGLSRSYLDAAVAYYPDELGAVPKLVEIKDSMFDIISGGLN